MIAEPTATAPAPPKRATPQPKPFGQRMRESASTASISPTGHTAAPTCGAIPGDQPAGSCPAGSQACNTFAAIDITEPNTKPVHATNRPPAGTAAGTVTIGRSPALVALANAGDAVPPASPTMPETLAVRSPTSLPYSSARRPS